MTDITKVLEERKLSYGAFKDHAKISQDLKSIMTNTVQWTSLDPDQKEALEMVMHKVARILNGNPNYADSWVDIAGYSQLIANRLCTKN